MGILFFVVTDDAKGTDGNFYDAILTTDGTSVQVNTFQGAPVGLVKMKCFQKGEVVIVDAESGREIPYPGRKPSKWFIGGEFYKDLEVALDRAKEIMEVKEGDLNPVPKVQPESAQAATIQRTKTQELVDKLKTMGKTELEKLPIYQQLQSFLGGQPQRKPGE